MRLVNFENRKIKKAENLKATPAILLDRSVWELVRTGF
jgi:hypothetical protein